LVSNKTDRTFFGLFTVLRHAQEFSLKWRETSPLSVKGCKISGLYSALRPFEEGGVFIVPQGLGFYGVIQMTALL
jgi:hypothetical protein